MKHGEIGDRFSGLTQIQRGQWAVSYKAFDTALGVNVFLKILSAAFQQDSEIVGRFGREVEIAKQIAHPNVVKLLDSGVIGSSSYISFEWIEGKPLDIYIKNQYLSGKDNEPNKTEDVRTLSIAAVLDYAKQLFLGLYAIHDAGIVHRDIKPGNILVDESGNIHIVDFSLAYSQECPRITPHEVIVGTPGYLAPEVVAGADVSKSSDLFSAGIIIYELLTSKTLFVSKDIYATLQKVHEAVVRDIRKIREDVPPQLWSIVKKLLSKHPADRYDGAEEVLNDLQKVIISDTTDIQEIQISAYRKRRLYRNVVGALIFLAVIIVFGIFIRHRSIPGEEESFTQMDFENNNNLINNQVIEDTTYIEDELSVYAEDLSDTQSQSISEQGIMEKADSVEFTTIEEGSKVMSEASEIVTPLKYANEEFAPDDTSIAQIDEPAAADSVKVIFEIYPWARVYCDGNYLGTTPILAERMLLNGERQLRFEHPDFPPLIKDINVVIADTLNIYADLTAEFGRLEFAVEPWAYLIIDDIEKGILPTAKPIYIQPGEHIVRLKHPSFAEIVKLVSVSVGETLLVEASFAQ